MATRKKPARGSKPAVRDAAVFSVGGEPHLRIKGDAPEAGKKARFKLQNGVIYSGTVRDASEDAGTYVVRLRDGLTPET